MRVFRGVSGRVSGWDGVRVSERGSVWISVGVSVRDAVRASERVSVRIFGEGFRLRD